MAATRIFVSHHHSPEEDTFTAKVVADLEAAGADVWVDTSGIPSGSFVAKISEGLEGRQWLVLVMTPDALGSPWVRAEVEAALQEVHGGRMLGVIPIMLQPCEIGQIPILWRTLQRYDASRDYASARDGLLRAMGLPLLPPPQQPGPVGPLTRRDLPPRRVAPPAAMPVHTPATSSAPATSAATAPTFDPAMLPPSLVRLGYAGYRNGATAYIVPPIVTVPAGEFLMGSDPKRDNVAAKERWAKNEQPQHRLSLPAFQIGKFPLTVAEYASFVRSGHTEPKSQYNSLTWKHQLDGRLDHPVVNVSWNDAVAYAAWLAKLTGEPWRLPTEAEWEKAARGTDGRIYPWGNTFDKTRCNTSEGGQLGTTPVGSYPNGASTCGAQDMAGNVWEWTSSAYKPYPYSATAGRENVNSTENRVLRGGSWGGLAAGARPTATPALPAASTATSGSGWFVRPLVREGGRRAAARPAGE